MAPVRIALGQFAATPSPAHNLRVCTALFHRAVAASAKLLFLPEASDYLTPTPNPALCTPDFLDGLRTLAAEHSLPILVGVHTPSPTPGKTYNTAVYISGTGEITHRYNKLHLFDVDLPDGTSMRESNSTLSGTELTPPFQTPAGMLGVQICFDLRFPQPAALLRERGAQVLCYPSAFMVGTGAAHWEVLLRARAMETQCWVVAPAQCGWHFEAGVGERCSYGESLVVDPWGRVVGRGGKISVGEGRRDIEDELVVCDIDLGMVEEVRGQVPLRGRNDVYGCG